MGRATPPDCRALRSWLWCVNCTLGWTGALFPVVRSGPDSLHTPRTRVRWGMALGRGCLGEQARRCSHAICPRACSRVRLPQRSATETKMLCHTDFDCLEKHLLGAGEKVRMDDRHAILALDQEVRGADLQEFREQIVQGCPVPLRRPLDDGPAQIVQTDVIAAEPCDLSARPAHEGLDVRIHDMFFRMSMRGNVVDEESNVAHRLEGAGGGAPRELQVRRRGGTQ